MENELTFREFNNVNVQRSLAEFKQAVIPANEPFFFRGLVGEVGEAANAIKKMTRGMDNTDWTKRKDADIKMQDIEDEIGDILTYLDLWASSMGLDLETCLKNKFNKVSDKLQTTLKL